MLVWFAKATPNHSPDAASSARDLRQRGKDICRPETQHAKSKLRGQQCLFGLKICYKPEALMQKSILGACSSRLEAGHSTFMHFRHASSIAPQGRQCCENNSDASVCPCRAACCEAFMPSECMYISTYIYIYIYVSLSLSLSLYLSLSLSLSLYLPKP